MKKFVFRMYFWVLDWAVRTGIVRAVLPLPLRKVIGQLLKTIVKKAIKIDYDKPYQVFGHKIWLYPKSMQSWEIIFGLFEQDTVNTFQRILKPGMTVLDIGAFVGYYTLLAANLVGKQGKVYAFEPNPVAFAILTKNIKENGYQKIIQAIPKAVSNRHDNVCLFVTEKEAAQASLYAPKQGFYKSIQVETVILDEFFAQLGWPQIDVVKIDVEGAEVEVLDGMKEVVRRNPQIKLIIEFNPANQLKSIGNYYKFFEVLQDLGFHHICIIDGKCEYINIPRDIPRLVKIANSTIHKCVNLLCERS